MNQQLASENERLRERVAELEEKLGRKSPRPSPGERAGSTNVRKVIEILKHKDRALEKYAMELEEKNERLEKLIEELRTKNDELTTWLNALRLYQQIFECDPAALLGLDAEKNIIQFNRAAVSLFGEELAGMMLQPFESLDYGKASAELPRLVDQVLAERSEKHVAVPHQAGEYQVAVFPLGREEEVRGVIVRVGGLPAVSSESP